MPAELDIVRRALDLLAASGVRCWVFGGWAEELHGLAPAGAHRDIDLLCVADDFSVVDAMLRSHHVLDEIPASDSPTSALSCSTTSSLSCSSFSTT